MEYLYHRIPKDMRGGILYPLNALKHFHPDIYAEQVQKYKGREKLLDARVPPLECLWNDVLHLTALPPHILKKNLLKTGIEIEPRSWFKIPVSLIKGENSIAFTYRRDKGLLPEFKEYEVFDPARMEVYRTVPEETILYYKQKKAAGERPLFFHLVPHVLYRGTVNTKDLEIVSL